MVVSLCWFVNWFSSAVIDEPPLTSPLPIGLGLHPPPGAAMENVTLFSPSRSLPRAGFAVGPLLQTVQLMRCCRVLMHLVSSRLLYCTVSFSLPRSLPRRFRRRSAAADSAADALLQGANALRALGQKEDAFYSQVAQLQRYWKVCAELSGLRPPPPRPRPLS